MKKKSKYIKKELLKKFSSQYHEMINVFMKIEADKLSLHRKKNHEINLNLGTTASYNRNYKLMSKKKLKTVKKYINEHLGKEFIRPNSLSALSSVFLIKKLDGKLRFCVNYRGLNAITVKNRYSIFFLHEIFEKLSNAKIFSKLNVIDVFNKMKIKKKHK